MKKVLLLGAGLVSKPLARYLLEKKDIELTVATRTVEKANKLTEGKENGKAVPLNITEEEAKLDMLVSQSDLVISLLPYVHHVKVADMCIKHKKNMVTTSYVSPAMKERNEKAKEAGITILNEIGVDPGIDHMSAMRVIDHVKKNDGKIISFKSYCGGLPAPEANTNPFGYKFSWSPRGVLMAARNPAKYLEDGKIIEIPSQELFSNYHFVEVPGAGVFEAYPNRDSLPYMELYGLKDCKTMSRWTLRNISHCETWKAMADLGLFSEEEIITQDMTYAEFILSMAGKKKGKRSNLKSALMKKLKLKPESVVVKKFEWLGLFSEKKIGKEKSTPIDILAELMLEKMEYAPSERDMLLMHHEFIAEFGSHKEKIFSTMVDYGIKDGDSSMSRTVSLPAAIASAMILDGKIDLKGVLIPVFPQIYEPVLDELKTLGIECKESTEKI